MKFFPARNYTNDNRKTNEVPHNLLEYCDSVSILKIVENTVIFDRDHI